MVLLEQLFSGLWIRQRDLFSLKRAIRQLYPLEVTFDVHELNQLDVKSEEDDSKDIPIRHVADADVQEVIV